MTDPWTIHPATEHFRQSPKRRRRSELLARGCSEWRFGLLGRRRHYTLEVEDKIGHRYSLVFPDLGSVGTVWKANAVFSTDTGGEVIVKIREDSMRDIEARADALWRALGSCYGSLNDWVLDQIPDGERVSCVPATDLPSGVREQINN